jgi:hypothetical protein
MLLDATTKTLEAFTEAITTTNCIFTSAAATFAQPTPTGFTGVESDGALNGVTAVTIVAAPASGSMVQVKEFTIYNADSVQHNVTVQINNNGTKRILIAVAVPTLQSLRYSDSTGFTLGAQAAVVLTGSTSSTNIAAPTAPNSTSVFTMQGLAGAITPTKSGKIQITIGGTIQTTVTTVASGVALQISHGTSTAPTTNAALTGTQDGNTQQFTLSVAATAAADVSQPFSLTAVVTGLTLGTAYWIDLAAKALTATGAVLKTVNITAIEL